MDPEELNNILLHDFPTSLGKQAYIWWWDFEGRSYKDTCKMFKRMETSEAIYEGGAPPKNTQQEQSDRSRYGRKKKLGSSASPSNPEQVRSGKRRRNNAGHMSDDMTGERIYMPDAWPQELFWIVLIP